MGTASRSSSRVRPHAAPLRALRGLPRRLPSRVVGGAGRLQPGRLRRALLRDQGARPLLHGRELSHPRGRRLARVARVAAGPRREPRARDGRGAVGHRAADRGARQVEQRRGAAGDAVAAPGPGSRWPQVTALSCRQ